MRKLDFLPRLGRYEVLRELGKGAMGIVYLGRDPEDGRVVALKTLELALEGVPDGLQEIKKRFLREAETAGRLTHPNIVSIYDSGEEHGLAYIAMEFQKGGDLGSHIRLHKLLPLPRVLSIVARVAEALAYAHRNNVVHRDIKPANILYEVASDSVKVADFGIARITDSSNGRTGRVRGTPFYMSPEQLAGEKIEGRSDLFSLGAALYQLVCGRLPFEGDSMPQLMLKIANEAHPDVRTHSPKVPACVAEIINRALAKHPDHRYPDGDKMADALRLGLQRLTDGAARPAAAPVPAMIALEAR